MSPRRTGSVRQRGRAATPARKSATVPPGAPGRRVLPRRGAARRRDGVELLGGQHRAQDDLLVGQGGVRGAAERGPGAGVQVLLGGLGEGPVELAGARGGGHLLADLPVDLPRRRPEVAQDVADDLVGQALPPGPSRAGRDDVEDGLAADELAVGRDHDRVARARPGPARPRAAPRAARRGCASRRAGGAGSPSSRRAPGGRGRRGRTGSAGRARGPAARRTGGRGGRPRRRRRGRRRCRCRPRRGCRPGWSATAGCCPRTAARSRCAASSPRAGRPARRPARRRRRCRGRAARTAWSRRPPAAPGPGTPVRSTVSSPPGSLR